MSSAWLGLGGNIGDVEQALATALSGLDAHSQITIVRVSSLYKTPPWGVEDQPWFLNCCAQLTTSLDPLELLHACQEREKEGKRERLVRWGPRTIDIDLLAYDDIAMDSGELTIPHPRIMERAFVVVPLAEIAPQLQINGHRVKGLADEIAKDGMEQIDGCTDWWKK